MNTLVLSYTRGNVERHNRIRQGLLYICGVRTLVIACLTAMFWFLYRVAYCLVTKIDITPNVIQTNITSAAYGCVGMFIGLAVFLILETKAVRNSEFMRRSVGPADKYLADLQLLYVQNLRNLLNEEPLIFAISVLMAPGVAIAFLWVHETAFATACLGIQMLTFMRMHMSMRIAAKNGKLHEHLRYTILQPVAQQIVGLEKLGQSGTPKHAALRDKLKKLYCRCKDFVGEGVLPTYPELLR